jgi:Sulfotransferase domain
MPASSFKVDFLGIGPAKAGTTWLGHMLEAHPDICMAEPKEVHFFNDSLSFNRSYDRSHFQNGIDWYKNHFKHCTSGKVKGEVTPRYIIDPVVPQRLYDHNPELKFIVCLRSPFERIISHYHSAKDYHKSETRSISEAIRQEPEYIEACLYHKNISRFLPLFDLTQFYFMDMEEVKTNPSNLLTGLYGFLGVNPSFVPSGIETKSNPARTTRSVFFRKWSSSVHRWMIRLGLSPFILFLKKLGVGKLINRLNSSPVEKVTLSPDDREFIRKKIETDVRRLGQLLQKDFSGWLK